jgi:hypothetical protein
MALRLRPRDPSKYQVGNAILYGGEHKIYDSPKDEVHEAELFFVETDFGNHMKLTWGEVMEMYTVAGWQDYELWRASRDELRQQTPFNEIGFGHYDPTFLGNTFQP